MKKTDKCIRDYTVINSQPSIEALDNLIREFYWLQGLCYTIDDVFYYGVFCKPQNYVNFEFDENENDDFEIPYELINECASENEKLDYVLKIIKKVMHREITKPEWMKYIEMNMDCNEYGMPPSTFLQLEAKDPKHNAVTEKLIEFLYSPNILMTMVNA